nr:putative ribonuclease H-like domain-containing protein [Tanacetum cinerariifolium]
VPTYDVPIHSINSTDSMFDGEPITRFPCLSDLGNHDPSPGIFFSSSYDDELDTALNNVESSMEVSLVPTKRINTIHPQSLIIEDPTSIVQTCGIVKQNSTGDSAFISSIFNQQRDNHTDFHHCLFACFLSQVKPRSVNMLLGLSGYSRTSEMLGGLLFITRLDLLLKDIDRGRGEFQMSAMGELTFFLGLQVQQRPDGTFIHQDKYVQEILHKFDLGNVRTATTPYEAPKPKFKSESDSPVNSMRVQGIKSLLLLPIWKQSPLVLEAYSDSDYVGENKDRKSITGGCQFLDEVFALVARIEAILLFLAFATYMGFLVYQMDVKSAFLYVRIDKELYVTQPKGFVDPHHPKKVYKLVKALYGLHQAPRAWYATLFAFLLKHGYKRGTIDKTLFLKKNNCNIILVQVYVDDIVFGSTKKEWCDEFEAIMKGEFQMSAMGELTFFLGLQVQQRPDG